MFWNKNKAKNITVEAEIVETIFIEITQSFACAVAENKEKDLVNFFLSSRPYEIRNIVWKVIRDFTDKKIPLTEETGWGPHNRSFTLNPKLMDTIFENLK